MNTNKTNEIFGHALFIVGALKIVFTILVVMQLSTNLVAISNGGTVNGEYFPIFSTMLGSAQLILAVGSVIMIIVNSRNNPEVIGGYLIGLGALLLEFITPTILAFFVVFIECSLYMKAGSEIINKNSRYKKETKKSKRKVDASEEWFYSEKK